MVKDFKKSEAKLTMYDGAMRRVCPDCAEHIQVNPNDVGCDCGCKNLFYVMNNGKKEVVGQCGCYSKEHE